MEWGCGGSTFAAIKIATEVVSVESSKTWCNKVLNNMFSQCAIFLGKLHFICVDAGETSSHTAVPLNLTSYNYSLYTNVMDHFSYSPDLVFIDGRLRVATAMASYNFSKADSIMLVHDYYDRPDLMADILKFSRLRRKTGHYLHQLWRFSERKPI